MPLLVFKDELETTCKYRSLSCFVNKVFICEICVIKAKISVVFLFAHKLSVLTFIIRLNASPCMLNVSMCFYEPQGIGK